MPKLGKEAAKKVGESTSGFDPLPEDTYVCSLVAVEVREGGKGPYWSWEFDVAFGDMQNRKLWVNTSLADNAQWKLKEVFDAFGVGTDTDTDELIGQVAQLSVSQRVIEQGARAGQVGNNVDRVMPYSGEGEEEEWDGKTPI